MVQIGRIPVTERVTLRHSPKSLVDEQRDKQGGCMKLGRFGKSIAMGGFSLALLMGVQSVSAQNYNEEYREWQRAQREAQQEYQQYVRTRSRRDYRDWQQAQRRAQQEYAEFRRTAGYNNRYYNNRYGNNNYRYGTTGTTGWYRINRGGSYYNVDQRQYALLRDAVNRGYQQGYNAGIRDRRYGYGDNYYYNDRVYRTGTYGYQSYVNRDLYQYYFQQGFQRGYQDGYNNSYRYGYRTNTGLNILGNVLSGILQLVD